MGTEQASSQGTSKCIPAGQHGWGFWEQPEDTHTSTSQHTEGSPAPRSSLNPQGCSMLSMPSWQLTGFLLSVPSFSECQGPSCSHPRRNPAGWSCWGRNRLSVSPLAAVGGWILPLAMSDRGSLGMARCPGCPQPAQAGMGRCSMPWEGVVPARGSHSRDSELGFYGSHMFPVVASLQRRGGRGKHKNSLQQLLPCACPPHLHPKTLPPPSLQPGEGAGRGSGFRGVIWGLACVGAKENNVQRGSPACLGTTYGAPPTPAWPATAS